MTADSEKSPGVSNHRSFLQGRSICPEEGPPASLLLPHCCAALCSPAQGLRFHFPREGIYDHPRHRRGLRSDRSGKGSVPGHSPLASRLVSVSHVRSAAEGREQNGPGPWTLTKSRAGQRWGRPSCSGSPWRPDLLRRRWRGPRPGLSVRISDPVGGWPWGPVHHPRGRTRWPSPLLL